MLAETIPESSTAPIHCGDEHHRRRETNYVTWVRWHVAGGPTPPYSPEDFAGQPITLPIGGFMPAAAFLDDGLQSSPGYR
jgi:hypothetical protein